MISNSLVYDLSEAVLISLFVTKKKVSLIKYGVVSGGGNSASVVDKQLAAQLLPSPVGLVGKKHVEK